jgi:hypothetical protein
MSAGYADQYIEQGTTVNIQLALEDYCDVSYNLGNFFVRSQARTSYTTANAAIVFSASVYDAANGIIQLSLDAGTCSQVKPGKLLYDVLLIDKGSGAVTRVLEGTLFVSPSVTQM